jgi:hypothetical protein
LQVTPTPEPKRSELDDAQRDTIYRLIAEDRDRQVFKEKHLQLKYELAGFVATGVPNPQVFPFDNVLDLLVDSHLRYCEIRRRLVPPFQDPEADGPWKAAFEQQVAALRATGSLVVEAGADHGLLSLVRTLPDGARFITAFRPTVRVPIQLGNVAAGASRILDAHGTVLAKSTFRTAVPHA